MLLIDWLSTQKRNASVNRKEPQWLKEKDLSHFVTKVPRINKIKNSQKTHKQNSPLMWSRQTANEVCLQRPSHSHLSTTHACIEVHSSPAECVTQSEDQSINSVCSWMHQRPTACWRSVSCSFTSEGPLHPPTADLQQNKISRTAEKINRDKSESAFSLLPSVLTRWLPPPSQMSAWRRAWRWPTASTTCSSSRSSAKKTWAAAATSVWRTCSTPRQPSRYWGRR